MPKKAGKAARTSSQRGTRKDRWDTKRSDGAPNLGTGSREVNERKKRFAVEYVANGGNQTQAAIAAGYSVLSAPVAGSKLTKDNEVRGAIGEAAALALEKSGITAERVLKELSRIAFADPRKLFDSSGRLRPIHTLGDDEAAVIASMDHDTMWSGRGPSREAVGETSKVRMWDKMSALDKAMKHLGLFERDNSQRAPSLDMQINVGVANHPPARDKPEDP